MNFIKKQLESMRQYSFPRTRALEQELDTVREAHTVISADLEKVRDEQQRTHEDEVRLLSELRQQVKQVKSERSHAQYQIEVLERSLAHAEQRQKFTETHVESLETKLEEERNRHEASMLATETRQAHLQAEQQSQLQQQTDLANTFHRVSTRLFESVQETNNKRRFSLLQLMIIGGLFFATGTLIGGVYLQYLRDGGQELTVLKQDIRGVMADGMEELTDIILPVATGGEAVSRGEIHIHRRGVRMPLGLNVNHVTGINGRVIGAITIFTDLTREKEMSARIRESDRLATIGELAASIAHEIRNPLGAISHAGQLLSECSDLKPQDKRLTEIILTHSERVNRIIEDILQLSKR